MPVEEVRLTREELYEQVWSEPMSKLAKQYGLSDVGLAKICRKLRIPVPYRGYWRKKEVGQHARRTPLAVLRPSVAPELREVKLRTHADEVGPVETGPVAEQERFESRPENRIHVPAVLSDPHPLVAQSVIALRRAKPDSEGYLQPKAGPCLSLRVTIDAADRAMCIMDALLKALDGRGYPTTIRTGDRPATVVKVGEEEVSIAIEERINRVERTPPARSTRQPVWGSPRYDWQATGLLALKIEHFWGNGIRRTWSDGKQQRVENSLNAFIVGLVAVAEADRALRLEREAREREYKAAEERRMLEARRREEEAGRIRALDRVLTAWHRSRLIREYVSESHAAAERQNLAPTGSPLADWLTWVEAFANRIDPLLPAPTVPPDPEPRSQSQPWLYQPARESLRGLLAGLEVL